jgi:hypothetical protein
VDGRDWKKVDTFTAWSSGNQLPWAVMLERDLSPGKHTVTVRTANEHNPASRGNALRVMYLLEN